MSNWAQRVYFSPKNNSEASFLRWESFFFFFFFFHFVGFEIDRSGHVFCLVFAFESNSIAIRGKRIGRQIHLEKSEVNERRRRLSLPVEDTGFDSDRPIPVELDLLEGVLRSVPDRSPKQIDGVNEGELFDARVDSVERVAESPGECTFVHRRSSPDGRERSTIETTESTVCTTEEHEVDATSRSSHERMTHFSPLRDDERQTRERNLRDRRRQASRLERERRKARFISSISTCEEDDVLSSVLSVCSPGQLVECFD